MRVRPLTPSRPRAERRPHLVERPVEPVAPIVASPVEDHPAERRHRASVAPEDTALYTCGCGLAFQAAVTTSVACPRCGSGQAW